MTQSTFPFSLDEETDAPEQDGQRNKKAMLVAGGVAAALVLGAAGYFLLGGAGNEADTAFVPVVHHAPVTGAAKVTPKTAVKKLPVAYDAQIGRDPFKALYIAPVAAAAPAGAGAPAVAGTPTTVATDPTLGGSVPPTGSTDLGTGTTPVAPVDKEYKLVLVRVYGTGTDRTAVFTIDGKQQVAKIGTKFGPTSEIVLLSFQQGPKPGQWTTVLQVGDGDPFDVVTAVPAYVR